MSFFRKIVCLTVALLSILPLFANVKWKKYETATFNQSTNFIDITFDQSKLSGIQSFVPLKKGKYQIEATLSGQGRVFFAIYSNRKWIYSPSYNLSKEKKSFSFVFSLNIDGNHCVAILARKNSCQSAQISKIKISPIKTSSLESQVSLDKIDKKGYLVASYATVSPKIDGKLDDDIWVNKSISITPFLSHKVTIPAKEKTTSYIAYDNNNLYVAFKGEALALQAKSNQFASFIQNSVRNDDANLLNDDYFALVFGDVKSNQAWDFFFNAKGFVVDSQTKLSKLWAHRQVKWNSHAKIATSINEGYWICEVAIPWKNLNIKPDKNAIYKFHLGRYNPRAREKSSWQFVKYSFHGGDSLSTLKLGAQNSSVNLENLPLTPIVSTDFIATANNKSLALIQEVNHKNFYSKVINGQIKTSLPLDDTSVISYRYSFANLATNEILFASPLVNIPIDFPKLEVKESIVPIFVNGKSPANETKNNNHNLILFGKESPSKLSFNKEVNVLAFEITNDKVPFPEILIKGKKLSLEDNFLYKSTLPSKDVANNLWKEVSYNDADWEIAQKVVKKGFYRKKIINGVTSIGPNWSEDNPIYINANMIQPILFYPTGIKGINTPKGVDLIVETPLSLQLLGSSSFYNLIHSQIIEEKVVNNTRKYRIRFRNAQSYKDSPNGLYQWNCLTFKASKDAKGKDTIRFYLETVDKKLALVPRNVSVNFLPQLNAAKINGILQFWTWPLNTLKDSKLADLMFNSILQVGANEIEDGQADASNLSFRKITLAGWSISYQDFIKKYPHTALIRGNGKADKINACPFAILSKEGQKHFHNQFIKFLNERPNRPARIIWDFESSAFLGLAACYCQKCRTTFAKEFNLKQVPKSIAQIRKSHSKEWVKFQTQNVAKIIKQLHVETQKVKIPLSVYSGYQNDFTKENYSIDWSLLSGNIELAICGYGQAGKALLTTINALGKTPLLNSLILQPYSITNPTPPTPISCATILKTVLDSNSNGAMLFQYFLMDGRTFAAIAQSSQIRATNKEFFIGSNAKNWKSSYPNIYFKQAKDKVLIIALNDLNKSRECSFTTPNGKIVKFALLPWEVKLMYYNLTSKSFYSK